MLTRMTGRHVRVSGALRHVDHALLTIDDGSASALVRLLDGDATFQPPLMPGEVLNVTGVVGQRDVGGWEVLARSEALVRASSLALPTPALLGAAVRAIPSAQAPAGLPNDAAPAQAEGPGDSVRLGLALAVAAVAAFLVMIGGAVMTRPRRRHGPPSDPLAEATAPAPPDATLDAP
jgi:hypothetical protein